MTSPFPRFVLYSTVLLATAAAGACDMGVSDAPLDTPEQRASYAIGRSIGDQLSEYGASLDFVALLRGMNEAMDGVDSPLPESELQAALQAVSSELEAARLAELETEHDANREAGDAFQAEFRAREGASVTASGLIYEVLVEGGGDRPAADDRVLVHYTGTLIDDTLFDTSRDGDPAEFSVGGLIEGFSEALQLMREGSTFRVVIPPDLGYGRSGTGDRIGPGATLVFEIELIEVIDG